MLKTKQRCLKTIVLSLLMVCMVMVCLMQQGNLFPRAYASKGGNAEVEETAMELQINNPAMKINGIEKEIDPGKGTAPILVNGTDRKTIISNQQSNNINAAQGLIRFSVVEPQSKYPRGLKVSERYRVLVKPVSDNTPWDTSAHLTATYDAWPDYRDPEHTPRAYVDNHVHIAQVDASERVRVRVELIDESVIDTIKLKPSRYTEMRSTQENGQNWVEFEIDASVFTKHVLVEINAPEQGPYSDGLVIFVNPISKMPKGNVLVLPSGIVDSSHPAMNDINAIIIEEDSPYDAMYIPQDTIVDGRIQVIKKGFKIAGRGMVIGSRWKWGRRAEDWREGNYDREISPDGSILKPIVKGSENMEVEGITTIHPYHFNYEGAISYTNAKAFGWRFTSDAFHGTIIRGCFARVNDDSTYCNKGVIEHCTIWAMQNGSPFQLGWGQNAANAGGGTRVTACNIVRGDWRTNNANNAVFSSRLGCNGDLKDVRFEDIRVDGTVSRFISYAMAKHTGKLENFVFKNIWFENAPTYKSFEDGSHITNFLQCGGGIEGFVFDNVVIGGKKIRSIDDLEPLEQKNIGKITFK
ncbi:MAG: hypothetical protein MJB12_21150 [Firmicutes bacterium]|nr:hypothetical protein [Bacillota bacterium]